MKYSFKCNCGDVLTVDVETKEEAVEKIKGMMNEDAIKAHMAEKHPGEVAPSVEQVHAQIESGVVEGDLSQDQGDAGGQDGGTQQASGAADSGSNSGSMPA